MALKNKKTYYQLILDKSGSMHDCVSATVNGFNEQMQMIRSMKAKYPEQEFVVSLTTFNHNVDFDLDQEDPDNIKELAPRNSATNWIKNNDKIIYQTDGMTALYDAIGMSIKKIQNAANDDINNDLASVVVVIITDGHENSSLTYNFNQIQSMIKELEASDNWTFSYLSNTPDAVDYAVSLNIKEMNAIRYQKSNMKNSYDSICSSMDNYFEKKQHSVKEKNFIKPKQE